jgi:hypothetical protein
MKNLDQAQQLIEKLLLFVHIVGLKTQVVDSGKWTSRGLKKIVDDAQ